MMTSPPLKSSIEVATPEVGRIAAADRDRGGWWVRSEDSLIWLTNSEFLEAGRFRDFDLLVVEAAHLIARADPPQSKAQVFTAAQLKQWQPGCRVRTVKELHAAKRRLLAGVDGKDKGSDAAALYEWARRTLEQFGHEGFRDRTRRFPFRPVPAWLTEIIQDCNRRQNTCRYWDYEDPESKRALTLLGDISDVRLNPIRNSKVPPGKKSRAKLKPSYVLAAYTALYDSEGVLRTDPQGRPLGTNTIRRVLGLYGDAPRSVARGKIQHDLFGSGLGRATQEERAARVSSDEYREHRQHCEHAMLYVVDQLRTTSPLDKSSFEAATRGVGSSTNGDVASPRSKSSFEAATQEVGHIINPTKEGINA